MARLSIGLVVNNEPRTIRGIGMSRRQSERPFTSVDTFNRFGETSDPLYLWSDPLEYEGLREGHLPENQFALRVLLRVADRRLYQPSITGPPTPDRLGRRNKRFLSPEDLILADPQRGTDRHESDSVP